MTRAVRVKQCLPDLCPMMAPLGPIHPTVGKTLAPFTLPGLRVGWIGVNAAGKRCAVFYSHGTLVEVAEHTGNFETEELVPFCASFAPISMAAVYAVEKTPLAKLTYFSRYCKTCKTGYAGVFDCKIASSLFSLQWPVPNSGAARSLAFCLPVALMLSLPRTCSHPLARSA